MLSPTVSANELFLVVASKSSTNETKLHHIQQLKSHVKKDLVDISLVAKYVEALAIAVDIPDLGILTVSFSVLSHLVKRVSMQDKSGNVLKGQSFLILPIIINRLGDSKASTRSSARKALEAYWFSAPKQVEEAVAEIALNHRNPSISLESILWLDHIVMNVNQHFKLDSFLPALAQTLASSTSPASPDVVDSIKSLFSNYYNLRQNRLYKFDLAKKLENHEVPLKLINEIMKDITGIDEGFIRAGEVRADITETEVETGMDPKLQSIINNAKYAVDSSIPPLEVRNSGMLQDIMNDVISIFNGRETEFNWTPREKQIIKLRSILRGNTPIEFKDDLLQYLKEASDAINKAVSTLRTTLSSHGCHFVKECAIVLQADFDPLVECFLPTLIKLCSATKLIASTNANHAITAIFASCSYNYRLLQRVLSCAHEKNVQPRTYSGVWVQILLLRFHSNQSFLSVHTTAAAGVEVTSKIIQKLLGDPNPAVRQVAKDTFWCFWSKFQNDAENLLTKLEPNIVKNLERSRPQAGAGIARLSSAPKKPRSSIKESIIQRNKELKSKQREAAINSRPSTKAVSRSATPTESLNIKAKSTNQVIEDLPNITRKEQPLKSTIQPEKPKAIEEPAHTEVAFDKQADPILKFLSSNQTGLIEEGVNLLKYAILGNEDLSTEINGLLRKISIRDPYLLGPLFLSGDNLFRRSYQFFSPEDFLRICCILIEPSTDQKIESIISLISADQIYDSVTRLLSYTISTSNILDDDELTIQIIRFKSSIIKMAVSFLLVSLDRIPISDSNFLKLCTNLLELVSLLKSTEVYPVFSSLMVKLHTINPILYTSELELVDESTKEEVELLVGIDRNSAKTLNNMNNLGSLFDLTQVNHRGNIDKFSPVKLNSDFTMIMPIMKNNNEFTYIPKAEPLRPVSNDTESTNEHQFKPEKVIETSVELSSDHSIEIVDDFAQVTLTSELEQRDPVQKFIEKMDPLKSISNKNKQISIFEDAKGSPQKVRDYNYSKQNWFNFQLAKTSVESLPESTEDIPIESFKDICTTIRSDAVNGRDFIGALNYLQNLDSCDLEFHKFFEKDGKSLLESSLWSFFKNDKVLTQSNILSGIILLKQLLINRYVLDLQTLWDTLLLLNKIPNMSGELVHATDETFEEMISGLYGSHELFACVLHSLNSSSNEYCQRLLLFIMGSLSKLLKTSISISDAQIELVDQGLFKLMNNDAVEVRRSVIMIYSILLKTSRNSRNQAQVDDKNGAMQRVLLRLSLPQQKLVEFYSHE
ncbi:uncharacterized protein CANTADRAFT_55826 [Suhomyces tanzawaensis NRRL Y-17324]|uniref:Protein STU1 n=1 Tax=Suhomyces tanzawaensis NRRL Y-17324 TaxID=984487 RepID=A0A1E4SDB3_9ASCO|nr:uncharacterized protein CANTADRAFT_55826 [Suhomyces tanzawaensis NRRL Y-17324]ODV77511.1 hypothetical protein CANTADRAFT_55826 [Suhomyces tanzawaensis NRRL Y-17324]